MLLWPSQTCGARESLRQVPFAKLRYLSWSDCFALQASIGKRQPISRLLCIISTHSTPDRSISSFTFPRIVFALSCYSCPALDQKQRIAFCSTLPKNRFSLWTSTHDGCSQGMG